MSQEILDAVWDNQKPHHDTLYVSRETYLTIRHILSTDGLSPQSVDNIKVSRLDVVPIEGLDVAILCEKGQIFPLAKDWQ